MALPLLLLLPLPPSPSHPLPCTPSTPPSTLPNHLIEATHPSEAPKPRTATLLRWMSDEVVKAFDENRENAFFLR